MARAARAARHGLSREKIEEAALGLVERDGLDAFSTRRLAADLGCEAMSIYHYFPSKQHLMDALLARFLAEVPVPDAGGDWQNAIRRLAADYRRAALRHRELFRFVVVHRHNTPEGLAWLEQVVRLVAGGGFDTETTARVFRTIGNYLGGALLDETAGYARGPSAAVPVADAIQARDYPRIVGLNPYFTASQHKATFDYGLDVVLAGIAAGRTEAASGGRRRKG